MSADKSTSTRVLNHETLDELEFQRGRVQVLGLVAGYLLRRDAAQGGHPRDFLRTVKEASREQASEDYLAGADEMITRLQKAVDSGA